jgi:hypothetical protein
VPRKSVENRAAAFMRPASKRSLPQPPEHLSPEARKLWARVIACKPADWFDDGNLPILAGYCDATVERDKMVLRRTELEAVKPAGLMDRIELNKALIDINRSILDHASKAAILAAKLRLTVQNTIDRRSGVLGEKQPEMVASEVRSSLLAGRRLDS